MQLIRSAVVRGIVSIMTVFLLAFATIALTTPNAQATPAIAKGKPCKTCHSGSPPSKSNLKR